MFKSLFLDGRGKFRRLWRKAELKELTQTTTHIRLEPLRYSCDICSKNCPRPTLGIFPRGPFHTGQNPRTRCGSALCRFSSFPSAQMQCRCFQRSLGCLSRPDRKIVCHQANRFVFAWKQSLNIMSSLFQEMFVYQDLGKMFQVLHELKRSCMSWQFVSSFVSLGIQNDKVISRKYL